jgi:hypothetical protein
MSFAEPIEWVDSDAAAAHLRITTQTLGRWITAYGLPCHQVSRRGRRWFNLTEVDAWLQSHDAVA